MLGLNGGLIGARRSPTSAAAAGLWTPNEQVISRRLGLWPGPGDPDYSSVSLLLPMDGSNGSTTFTDSSSLALVPTVNGNIAISTAQSRFGGASAYFDGNGSYLRYTPQNALLFTGDFTIEAFIRPDELAERTVFSSSSDSNIQVFRMNTSGNLSVYINTTFIFNSVTAGIQANTWHHVALCRSGISTRLFVDGQQKGTTDTSWTTSFRVDVIGQHFFGQSPFYSPAPFKGFLDEVRFTKGIARYTANFTAPPSPFPDY